MFLFLIFPFVIISFLVQILFSLIYFIIQNTFILKISIDFHLIEYFILFHLLVLCYDYLFYSLDWKLIIIISHSFFIILVNYLIIIYITHFIIIMFLFIPLIKLFNHCLFNFQKHLSIAIALIFLYRLFQFNLTDFHFIFSDHQFI